ncbi:sulfotransferase family 2 domain-containing protein [Luminiphilus sp.]|nr:sulfotransferase family 2 domain-containing protein [Luminiphilus sp.]
MKHYPEKYQEKDFVFFLHIPKTAGTSVTNALQAAFPAEHTLSALQMNNVRKYPEDIFLNAQLLCGHFTHNVYGKRLQRQPDFILTFLRDPLQHFISTFFHLKVDPTFTYTIRLVGDKALAEEIHAQVSEQSIEEFLEYPHSHLFDNFQTRYLVHGLSSEHGGFGDKELLPVAQDLLLNLPFFGITDRFNDSLRLLSNVMGLRKGLRFATVNASRNKPSDYAISDHALKNIEQRIDIDRNLYQFAQDSFAQRFDEAALN